MRKGRNTLNNMMMETQRRSPLYQTIITDLAIYRYIAREEAEVLLGYEIPDFLHTPDGYYIDDKDDEPKDDEPKDDEPKDDDKGGEPKDDDE